MIATQKEECVEIPRTSIRLLRFPINIQIQYSSGAGMCSLEQPNHQSYDVTSPAIHLLVSEYRVRAMLKLMETVRGALANVTVVAPDTPEATLRPKIPAMADYVLAKSRVSIQSLGIHVIPDKYEGSADDFSVQYQLEDAIASFATHLSCLDFDHPSQVAVDCISKLFMERCCALGISQKEARKCMEAARANFKSEVSATVFSSPSHDDANERRRGHGAVNHSRKINRHLTDAPLALSDALDQVVENSTRMTIAEFGDDLPAESKLDLGLVAKSLVISRSFIYGGNTSQITVKSLKVRNRQVNLLKILHSSDTQSSQSTSVPGENDAALAITIQNRSLVDRGCCQDIYFEAGSIESIFSPDAYLEAARDCGILFDAVSGAQTAHHPKRPVQEMIVNGSVSSLSLVLTDKLLPFIQCQFQDVRFKKSVIGSQTTALTSLHAGAVSIDCVSQSSYPNIISTYASENECSAFSIQLSTHLIPASGPNEFFIEVNGVRIVMLRQILNEIFQYISSPNYGIGLVLDRNETESGFSGQASQASPNLVLTIRNSSIVLPRDSISVDMVGLEVEEITITREQVAETWSIDKYSFSNDVVLQSPGKVGRTVASTSSSDIFFDCIDDQNFTPLQTPIQRYVVHTIDAHVFTALNPCHVSSREIHMPAFNASVSSTGRAVHGKRPFTVDGKVSESLREDLISRVWEKVNERPVNLRITVDHAPNLRLLVEDIDDGNSQGACFAMRMSQFYLVMSIWFSNMKELPILFPYDGDFVEKASIVPDTPTVWPEYGTIEFVNRLKQRGSAQKAFEMALCFKNLTWRCFYDQPDYFAIVPPSMSSMQSTGIESEGVHGSSFVSIAFKNAICSINNDEENLQRIGVGAVSMQIHDGRQRQDETHFARGLCAEGDHSQPTIVDLDWGLDCGRHTLIADGLPMPFQVTVFMTPDLDYLINLGVDLAEAALADLSPIWILLDYFGLYFRHGEYGHPAFEAELTYLGSVGDATLESSELDDNCLDFRLWMMRPHVIIPSSSELYMMFEAAGLYYRYKSIGQNYSSQEIVARDLGIVALGEYMCPSISRGLRQVSGSLISCGIQTLIEEMSFSLKYDFNASTSDTADDGAATAPYFKVALRMPLTPTHFERRSTDGIECSIIDAKPFCVPPPLVCKPSVVPSRAMGHQETIIYFSYEYMKLLLEIMTSFVGPKQQSDIFDDNTPRSDELPSGNCFSVIAHVERVKCVISDPVMGMHRPFLSVCLPSLLLTASELQIQQGPKTKIEKLTGGTDAFNAKDLLVSIEVRLWGVRSPFEQFLFRYSAYSPGYSARSSLITLNWD